MNWLEQALCAVSEGFCPYGHGQLDNNGFCPDCADAGACYSVKNADVLVVDYPWNP